MTALAEVLGGIFITLAAMAFKKWWMLGEARLKRIRTLSWILLFAGLLSVFGAIPETYLNGSPWWFPFGMFLVLLSVLFSSRMEAKERGIQTRQQKYKCLQLQNHR